MIVLGIESSCDETGVGIVRDGQILANSVLSSLKKHQKYGGVIPEIAARDHLESLDLVLDDALNTAKISLEEIDKIAVTSGPGLINCLSVGVSYAKALALGLNVDIVGVNHLLAHGVIATMKNDIEQYKFDYPILIVIVSGGHAIIYLVKEFPEDIEVVGTTLDDAPGEVFDKIGRIADLQYPAGPEIDKIVEKFAQFKKENIFNFPKGLTHKKFQENHKFDWSFSGTKTQVAKSINQLKSEGKFESEKEQLLSDFSEAITEVIIDKTLAAAEKYQVSQIFIGGGFSANSQLRSNFSSRAQKLNLEAIFPALPYCTDNGAMVALLGYEYFRKNLPPSNLDFSIDSTLEPDIVVT